MRAVYPNPQAINPIPQNITGTMDLLSKPLSWPTTTLLSPSWLVNVWPPSSTTYALIVTLIALPVLPTLSLLFITYHRTTFVPPHLPWAGLPTKYPRHFPKTRALLNEWSAGRAPIREGYEEYSKKGLPFVLPALHRPEVALPPHLNGWLIQQSDAVLSTIKAQDELLMLDYLGHGPDGDARHDFGVITRDLTRNLPALLPSLVDELQSCFSQRLAQSSDASAWKEVHLYEEIEHAARRAANRVFTGLPLCRDEKLMKHLYSAAIWFSLCGAILRTLVPACLRSMLAPLIGAPLWYQQWRVRRILQPTIEARMRDLQPCGGETAKGPDTPNDAIQWIVSSSYRKESNTFALSPRDIAGKTFLLNFFAVFTTAITAGTVLYDILLHQPSHPHPASPSNTSLLSQLREEAAAILPTLPEDPLAIRRMHKLDSTIRETLRYNPIFGRGVQRKVVASPGITTPDGLFLPKDTHVCAIISEMQRDASLLPNADCYEPLRYYHAASTTPQKQLTAVQISPIFLTFSLGKHACPGRFFAVQTLKAMLGILLLKWEIEVILPEGKEGVEWMEVGEARLPPGRETGMVRVRRRAEGMEREEAVER